MTSTQRSSGGPAAKRPRVTADSWSKVNDEPNTKHEHVFEIANFSEKMKMNAGKKLSSADFSIQTKDKVTNWYLVCYPNGQRKWKDCVSIYLKITETPEVPLKAKCVLSILDVNGSKQDLR